MQGVKVILYNDNDITYKEGYLVNIDSSPNIIETYSLSEEPRQIIDGHTETIECYVDGEKQSIELDPTTMQRILKYNKEVEIEKLNKEIESKKEEIKERDRKYRIKNKEKITKRQNEWCKRKNKTDNMYNLKVRIRHSIKRSLNKKGFEQSQNCEKILGCNYKTFVNHLLDTYRENYGEEYSNDIKVHIDHIIPLATAKTEEDVIKLNHYTNLQLLKAEDNLHKGAKIDWRLDDVK